MDSDLVDIQLYDSNRLPHFYSDRTPAESDQSWSTQLESSIPVYL